MPTLNLKRIDNQNMDAVIALYDTLSEAQKRCVAPNIYSLAEAYANRDKLWARAVILAGEPIGFVMLSLDEKEIDATHLPAYSLWRMMMAKTHQGKGHGRTTLDRLVDKCRQDGIKTLYTSCDTEGEQPYRFYLDYGFIDTNRRLDDEQLLMLTIR